MQDNYKNGDRPEDGFGYPYLPQSVASHFHDALACYRHGLTQPCAAMCRLTAQAVFTDLGESSKLKMYDQVEEVLRLAKTDDIFHRQIRDIIFDTDSRSLFYPQGINREIAAVLIEIIKDILHQSYIRSALLQKKLKMRRFFASQQEQDDYSDLSTDSKIAHIKPNTRS
jgi:hypothetical protein